MSYLNPLRLHFAGQYQTNVSTVNNDPNHFDNATFQASYQEMQGPGMVPPNGWFNPQGDAAFRLLGCTINSAFTASGPVAGDDPVLTNIVADSDQAVPAKLVDLDSEQQLVSEIWGLTVRIADSSGNTLMSGQFEPAAFMDIWDRAIQQGGGDTNASAYYQSVLTNVQWGDVSSSNFLTALKAASANGLLSIKFNVDGINMSYTSPDFMCGRITGTIGPQAADDPGHMIIGRQFVAIGSPKGNFFLPEGGINFFAASVDQDAGSIYLDLGNALPTTIPGGPIADLGDLTLAYYDPFMTPKDPAGQMAPLATIPSSLYAASDWYANSAGVVAMTLTPEQMQVVGIRRLALYNAAEDQVVFESPGACYVRADKFVYRLTPGDEVSVPIYAMRYGNRLPDAAVDLVIDNGQLQPGPSQPPYAPYAGPSPAIGVPISAVPIPSTVTTDANGMATMTFTANNPGVVRNFDNGANYGIDGQVYGVRPSFSDPHLAEGPVNQWNFISFLIWSDWTPSSPISWTDIQPIFQQYANLYPIMGRFLDMSDFDSVKALT